MESVQLAGQHHVWAGSTPVSSHPEPWPGFRPCSQQSCLFLAMVQLGHVCREQPGLSGVSTRVPGGERARALSDQFCL